jgi:DNA replication protein DnaC
MLNEPTADKLRQLYLHGMLKAFQEQTASSQYKDLTFEERLGLLVDREITEQENRRLTSRLRRASLRQQACLEDLDYSSRRNLDKATMTQLAKCVWVEQKLNILITGPCGVGKSYIACALAHKTCMRGHTALYVRATRLFEDMAVAKGDGRYNKLVRSLGKVNLLVIDDWGLSVLTEQERHDLLEILEERHNVNSTIVTSQLPLDHWHEAIGNPTLADAILDRLVHNAYKINLKGESLRKKNGGKPGKEE